jgi:UDPglucose 6-dehydrogenase
LDRERCYFAHRAGRPDCAACAPACGHLHYATAVVILTEWNVFRALDLEHAKRLLRRPIMVDLRNIYEPHEMMAAGFSYSSIGRPATNVLAKAEKAPA